MESKDKVEQLRQTIKAKQEAEAQVKAGKQSSGFSPGMEKKYQEKIAEMEKALEQLQADKELAEQKAKESHDRMLRLAAEFENFQKRMAKEKEDIVRYGTEKIVKEMLPVLDSLEKALEHADENVDKVAMVEGIELVLKQFLKTMEKFGVHPLDSLGKPFDPNYHEAMAHQETQEQAPDTVVHEVRRGYKLHDRLLRPSLVTVAKPPEKKDS